MRCYSHLSDDEREQIGLARTLGHSIGTIAQAIGRPKSTISRELSRNKLPSGRYSPLHAAGAYQLRRRREALIERDRALRTFVVDRLAEGWTPEQISGWLKAGNEHRLPAVGCETIYAFIYRAAQRAEQLWRYLTSRHNTSSSAQRDEPAAQFILIISTRTNLMTGWMRWIASGKNATLLRGEQERLMIRMSSVQGNASRNYWWRPNQLGRGTNDS
jgi:IS30 family transposase